MILAIVPFFGTSAAHLDLRIAASLLALGVLGTGFAYVWNNAVIAGWGATNASTVTYVIPIIGLALGIVVLGESLTWNLPVGGAVTIAGILISQGRLRLPHRSTITGKRAESSA